MTTCEMSFPFILQVCCYNLKKGHLKIQFFHTRLRNQLLENKPREGNQVTLTPTDRTGLHKPLSLKSQLMVQGCKV